MPKVIKEVWANKFPENVCKYLPESTATHSKIFCVHFVQRCENRRLYKTKIKKQEIKIKKYKITNLMCNLIHGLPSASVVI